MDELVKRVAENAGITEEQAREAVNTVVAFIKEKLPSSFAGQVDNFMNGGQIGSFGGIMGGLFGKKG